MVTCTHASLLFKNESISALTFGRTHRQEDWDTVSMTSQEGDVIVPIYFCHISMIDVTFLLELPIFSYDFVTYSIHFNFVSTAS